MRRIVPALFISILLSGCSLFGIRTGYEQPDYKIVERLSDGIEVRRYSGSVAAEALVEAKDRQAVQTAAFRLLFDYISGKNRNEARIEMTAPVESARSSEKIAMTTPVETIGTGEGSVRMRFFLPSSYSLDSAPRPIDSRVRIVEVPAQNVAVLRFSGFGGAESIASKTQKLQTTLKSTSWQSVSMAVTYFYDPPWTLPFFRRNEVAIRVVSKDSEKLVH